MSERPRRPVMAYFYPHSADRNVLDRAKASGLSFVRNETFRSGRCIDENGETTAWSDRDPKALKKQINLAENHGINGFIFDQYAGARNGVPKIELKAPLDAFVQVVADHPNFKFALACCLKGPPTIKPYPFDENLQEENRYFDFTRQTLERIVDHAAEYWDHPNFLRLGKTLNRKGRPFVGVYGLTTEIIEEFKWNNISNIGHVLRGIVHDKYHIKDSELPYFVAIVQSPDLAYEFLNQGFEATITYAGLATFSDSIRQSPLGATIDWDDVPVFQNYELQRIVQMLYWKTLLLTGGMKFYPSIVPKWDPVLRRMKNVDSNKTMPKYPYLPSIIGATPKKFFKQLMAVNYYYSQLPWRDDDFPYVVATWNDVGDGTDVLPTVTDSGVDLGYLQAIKRFQETLDLEEYARAMNQGDLKK